MPPRTKGREGVVGTAGSMANVVMGSTPSGSRYIRIGTILNALARMSSRMPSILYNSCERGLKMKMKMFDIHTAAKGEH